MVGLNDSRRDDPENFRLVFGAFNISDIEEDSEVEGAEQIARIDRIIKVGGCNQMFWTHWES